MSDVRIDVFPIRGLEHVFVPSGLPLITKTPDAPATTSILIRGGAGTGKTTLAVSLAHAIAREQEGVALYLTTEFVATELVYKAVTLGLSGERMPEEPIVPWGSPGEYAPGVILAEHLLRTEVGARPENVQKVRERKRAAINAVSELLGRETRGAPRPEVRVVVIDAFGLPEVEIEDDELRNDLLELTQSLEWVGITAIYVEEAGEHTEAWLPFVVDVVFEIELTPDPDTGDLLRHLKCPKSRYGASLAGPHDYGLDLDGVPSVWPDLTLSFDTSWAESTNKWSAAPPGVVIPSSDDAFFLCPPGAVLASEYDVAGNNALRALHGTPGVRAAHVVCGPMIRVGVGSRVEWIPESQGLFALAWFLIEQAQGRAINSVVVEGLEYVFCRPRSRLRALRMIAMLSRAGLSVCLHGRRADLQRER